MERRAGSTAVRRAGGVCLYAQTVGKFRRARAGAGARAAGVRGEQGKRRRESKAKSGVGLRLYRSSFFGAGAGRLQFPVKLQ